MDRSAEVKAAIEEEQQLVDAKLEALEQASDDRWAAIDQHIERTRESVLQGTGEVLGQFRAELTEFKRALEDKERAFDAKLADLSTASNLCRVGFRLRKLGNPKTLSTKPRWFVTRARSGRRAKTPRKLLAAQIGFASRVMVATRSRRRFAVPTMSMTATQRWTSSALTARRT